MLAAALVAPLVVAALARRPRELLGYKLLYAARRRSRRPRRCSPSSCAAGASRRCSAPTPPRRTRTYDVGAVSRWLLWHLSELDLYVGLVPVFALVLLCVGGKALSAAERAVVAATVSLVVLLAVEVAAFASQPSVSRIEERNLFYVAPLLFTCLLLWIERGMPRPRAAAVGCRSRCRRARRGCSVRAVHRHVGHLGHVRRACALVDGALAASSRARHPVAGRRSCRGARGSGRACSAAPLVDPPELRLPALPRRDPAGRHPDEASIDRRALPGDHALGPGLDHRRRRVERPSARRRPLDGGDRPAHRERERVLQPRRRRRLHD